MSLISPPKPNKNFPTKETPVPVISLVNYNKHLRKEKYRYYINRGGTSLNLFYEVCIILKVNPERHYKKKLQPTIPHENRCKILKALTNQIQHT